MLYKQYLKLLNSQLLQSLQFKCENVFVFMVTIKTYIITVLFKEDVVFRYVILRDFYTNKGNTSEASETLKNCMVLLLL